MSRYNRLRHGKRTAEAVERRRMFTAAMRHCVRCLAEHDVSIIAAGTILDLCILLRITEEQLEGMDAAALTAAAERVGVNIDDVDRWMDRRLKARTLAGAFRFVPPKPKKRPPPPPPAVRIVWQDTPPRGLGW